MNDYNHIKKTSEVIITLFKLMKRTCVNITKIPSDKILALIKMFEAVIEQLLLEMNEINSETKNKTFSGASFYTAGYLLCGILQSLEDEVLNPAEQEANKEIIYFLRIQSNLFVVFVYILENKEADKDAIIQMIIEHLKLSMQGHYMIPPQSFLNVFLWKRTSD